MEERFDFGALLDAQFKGMDRNKIRYAKADREEPETVNAVEEEPEGPALDPSIRQAYEQNLPIDGKVEKEVKGGYEVTVCGQRAFCPYSQIDRWRKETAKDYLRDTLEEGQTLNGTVVKIHDFGAVVELGGLQGLVPVREISCLVSLLSAKRSPSTTALQSAAQLRGSRSSASRFIIFRASTA